MSATGAGSGGARRVSLARATLAHEWRRFLPAVLAVAFSGLLVIVQLGLLLGMFRTVSTVIERARADLWAIEGRTVSFDLARPMPARIEMRLRAHPQVGTVQQLTYAWADWRRPDGGKVAVYVVGIDVSARSLSAPTTFNQDLRDGLRPLGSVVIDVVDADKLGVGVGDVAEINGHRVTVAGTTTGMRTVGGANVFASRTTAALISPEQDDAASYFLIALKDPDRSGALQAELQPEGEQPPWRIMTPSEFSQASQLYWLAGPGQAPASLSPPFSVCSSASPSPARRCAARCWRSFASMPRCVRSACRCAPCAPSSWSRPCGSASAGWSSPRRSPSCSPSPRTPLKSRSCSLGGE